MSCRAPFLLAIALLAPACNQVSSEGPVDAAPPALTVTLAGDGTGVVSSVPAGIDCGGDCSEVYAPGTSVTLTARATDGSSFDSWTGGGCGGNSR